MPQVPIGLLRAVVGLLCIFFAFSLGSAAALVRLKKVRITRVYGWVLRLVAGVAGLCWRGGLDTTAIVFLVLSAAAGGAGAWFQMRPKQEEDLSKNLFGGA
jgi:uncharacterized membrane protein